NAFQRHSSVVLQRSIREGFGFTVTEALWKSQPVVGTRVTGLEAQIDHGVNGFLVDGTEEAANYALQLLRDRQLWHEMGSRAHQTAKERFLFPSMILQYLKTLQQTMSSVSKP